MARQGRARFGVCIAAAYSYALYSYGLYILWPIVMACQGRARFGVGIAANKE